MVDTKAPERIWADQDNLTWVEAYPAECMKSLEVEYVSADLHDAATKQRNELAAELTQARAEIERLKAERLAADHSLVDRYRKPGSGIFSFPEDVAAIIRALDKAEAERDAALARKAVVIEQTKQALAMGEAGYSVSYNPDAQAALDKLIADARADAFKEAADMAANRGQQMFSQELRARINEPQEGGGNERS